MFNLDYKKTTWTNPQKKKFKEAFESHIKRGKYPTYSECQEVISKFPELRKRTPASIITNAQHMLKKYQNLYL